MSSISILIPCYNVEKYLRQCLESVINQTLTDIEIICINDGSTDSTLAILREYANRDSRIKIIDKPNSGYGASMNKGLEMASGEYIGIVESDDFVELNMFEILYDKAVQNDLDLVRCRYYQYNGNNDTNEPCFNEWVPRNRVYCPLVEQAPFFQAPAIWCNLVKKELIDTYCIRFLETPGASYQDTSYAFKLYASSKRFMMIDDFLLHYRIDNSSSSINSKSKAYCVMDEYAEIKRFAVEKEMYGAVKNLIPKIKYGCYSWNYARLPQSSKWSFLWKWHKEYLKDFIDRNIDKKLYTQKEYKKVRAIAFYPWLYAFKRSL